MVFFGKIIIEDGASSRMIKNVWKKSVIAFSNKVRDAIEARKSTSRHAFASEAIEDNVITKLEKLAVLLEKGIINQEEFTQQKAKILA